MKIGTSVTRVLFGAILLVGSAAASAATINLADFLGVGPGSSTNADNSPYTTIVAQGAYGFGNNAPGNFSSVPLDFNDTPPFTTGIGAHPSSNGDTRIRFNLTSFRASPAVGDTFSAIVGIHDYSSALRNGGGAVFHVYLDGLEVLNHVVASRDASSFPLTVQLNGASTLELSTTLDGEVFGNWAAWGNARLDVANPVPLPAGVYLLVSSLAAIGMAVRRRHST